MFERQVMREGFKPVVGGCSSNMKQGNNHWCGWVDLNTSALISGFTKQDDSTHSVQKAGGVMSWHPAPLHTCGSDTSWNSTTNGQ